MLGAGASAAQMSGAGGQDQAAEISRLAQSGFEAGGGPPPEKPPSPEEKMNRRFPQPVKVSFLIGLPMLDEVNSTLGRIESVQRTPEGKIKLVIGYGGFLGIGERPVAVPVELVAMLGDAVAAIDMPTRDFDASPTWKPSDGQALERDETIRVGVIRRSLAQLEPADAR